MIVPVDLASLQAALERGYERLSRPAKIRMLELATRGLDAVDVGEYAAFVESEDAETRGTR